MKFMRHLVILISMTVLGAWQAQAQLAVDTISPAHGSTNVPQNTTITVVFTQALDQTGQYVFDDTGDPVNWNLYPDMGETGSAYSQISSDGKTLTIQNVSLKPNTQYTFVVEGAFGADGSKLAGPAVVTFTTGDSLPGGSISGKVSGNNVDFRRVLVNLFSVAPFNTFFYAGFAVPDNAGNYVVPYLPPGTYFAVAMYDGNGNGEFQPEDGDLIAGYDPDGNKLVDKITLAANQSVGDINMTLSDAGLKTAREILQVVMPFVQPPARGGGSMGADPALVGIFGPGLDESGRSYVWGYQFYSSSADTSFGFFATSNLVVPAAPLAGDTSFTIFDTLKTPLPDNWMDSDAAMTQVKNAGAAEYLQDHPNARIGALAGTFDPDSLFRFGGGPNNNANMQKARKPKTKQPRQFVRWEAPLLARQTAAGAQAYWLFVLSDPTAEDITGIFIAAVDMATGNTKILTPTLAVATKNLQAAIQFAKAQVADARLVGIMAPPFFGALRPDGRAIFWSYLFYSASADSFFQFMISNNRIFNASGVDTFVSTKALPDSFMDSNVALAKAEQRGGAAFRQNNQGAFITATLAYGLYEQDPSLLVWVIQYGSFILPEEQWLMFVFNAETGDVLVNVERQVSTPPAAFRLEPIYPNPQRVGGSIHIPLTLREPARVEIALYNILGQQVRQINYGRLPAGSQTLRLQNLLRNLAAGMYFVQVRLVQPGGKVHRLMKRLIVQ